MCIRDSPSFGTAIIARVLEAEGYRVAVLAQPDWHSADAFRAMGRPRYGVTVSYTHLDVYKRQEIGNPVYPPARRKLAEHGISCDGHAARQLTNQDYDKYDLLIGMDSANLRNMYRICGGDFAGKLHLLMDYAGQ